MRAQALVIGAIGVLASFAASAAPNRNARKAAEEHVARANRAFRGGDYDGALAELQAGYEIEPRLEFLITFAQVYAAKGETEKAIAQCEKYLASAPETRLAPQVLKLERELERKRPPPAPPPRHSDPPPATEMRPPAEIVQPPIEPPVAASATLPPPVAVQKSPPPRRSYTWAIVGGAVLVAAGVALGVGLGIGLRDNAPATKLGTVPFQ